MPAAVTVAIVSTNLRELLAACLRSLEEDHRSGLADVWVVDNASTDGSPEMVAREFPWVNVIASRKNLGYGPAINRVAARTTSPWIAPANEDIELEPDALRVLLDTAEAHPEAAVVAPRLVLPDGSTQHSAFPFPSLRFALLDSLGVYRVFPRVGERACSYQTWEGTRPREVPWAIATFVLMRRSAFDEVGGFDESQWMHAEDLDIGWRLHRAGWKTRYEPQAVVHHKGSAASKKAFGTDVNARWVAATYAWTIRRRGLARERALAAINLAGIGARYGVARLRGRTAELPRLRYWLRLHRAGLRARPD